MSVTISDDLAEKLLEAMETDAVRIEEAFNCGRPAHKLVLDEELPEEYYQLLDAMKISVEDRAAALEKAHGDSMKLA